MNKKIIKSYISEYKKRFNFVNRQEIYKWKAVKQFQDNWNINAADFKSMLDNALKLSHNLLHSGMYFPREMLLKNAAKFPEEIRALFRHLFNEEEDIYHRIKSFSSEFKNLNSRNFNNRKDYQDHRAIMVYLALKYPNRFYFYKYKIFKSFADRINYEYKPVAGRIENIGQFQNLCNLVKHELASDQELLQLHKDSITHDCFYDKSLNILTQDFIYAVEGHLEISDVPRRIEFKNFEFYEIKSSEIKTKSSDHDFTPRTINYIQNNIENKRIGDLGELWVVRYEKDKLLKANKPKLAEKVAHVAKSKGDGLGYDILSYDLEGNELFIEVKTTKGNQTSPFYITRNELMQSLQKKNFYRLYRLYNFNEDTQQSDLLVIKGELRKLCQLPITYKVNLKIPTINL